MDFAKWLNELSSRFKRIILVAGNHDTPLDTRKYPDHAKAKREFLAALPQNAVYLENQSTFYRGIHIYGSPFVICRQEQQKKQFFSNSFERTNAERKAAWNNIPEDCEILLTHVPRRGYLSAKNPSVGFAFADANRKGETTNKDMIRQPLLVLPYFPNAHTRSCTQCQLLHERLEELAEKGKAPLVHCFGHDHDFLGLAVAEYDERATLNINAAQATVVRSDRRVFIDKTTSEKVGVDEGIGCALIFDLEARE